jgi:hypothetical protein
MSNDLDDAIKNAYDNFWSKREEIKKRQRQEIEDATATERAALAEAIWSARRSNEKYTVQDVADLLGITNRNFLYKILNGVPLIDPDPAKKPVGRPSSAQKQAKPDTEKSAPFHLTHSSIGIRHNSAAVSVRDSRREAGVNDYEIALDDEGKVIEIPEDWYVDTLTPDEVEFYKNLIRRIEEG